MEDFNKDFNDEQKMPEATVEEASQGAETQSYTYTESKPEEAYSDARENQYEGKQQAGGATIQEFDYQTYEQVEQKATKTASTIALVCGICSIVFDFIFCIIGIILGVIGIVFAVKGRKTEPENNGMATAGLVCSIIGLAIGAIAILCTILVIGTAVAGAGVAGAEYYTELF